MKRQARFSIASKGFLTAAVVMLIVATERPLSQPLPQAQHDFAERIHLYNAQPVELTQASPAPRSIDHTQAQPEQRWVF